jgi:predicted GIY-YIG superfamily endonuclease
MKGETMADTVYLLHFSAPYRHAKHYLGFARDLNARLADHSAGQGARLLAVARDAGITWTLARTWSGDRKLERLLKNRKESPALCPVCAGEKALNRAAKFDKVRRKAIAQCPF